MRAGILPSRQELLSRIDLVCGLDSSFVCVTGEQGIGKTALLEFFIEHQCKDHKKCFIHASSSQAPFELCEQVFSQLVPGATFDSQLTLLQNLASFEFEHGLRAIVVIDNGHHVELDVFSQLIELIKSNLYQVSVVFAALRDASKFNQLNSLQPLVEMHLEPLDVAESEMLLNFYYGDMVDGDRAQVKHFIEQAQGLPSELLKWDSADAKAKGNSKKVKNKAKSKAKVEPATVSADDLVLQQLAGMSKEEVEAKTQAIVGQSKLPLIVAAVVMLMVLAGASWYFIPKSFLSGESSSGQLSQREQIEQLRQAVAEQEKIAAQQKLAEQEKPAEQASTASTEEPQQAVKADDIVAQKWQDDRPIPDRLKFDSPEDKAVEDPKVIQVIRVKDKAPELETSVEQKAELQQEVTKTIEQKDTQDAKQDTQQPVKPAYLQWMDNEWFMAQDSGQSVIQLAGLSQKRVLTNYLVEHQLKDKAKVYQSIRYGKAWYVVTLGPYPNLAAARSAIGKLSAKLQANSPWAKSIKAIQSEIANAKE